MTLKAAWITPSHVSDRLLTLTLESAGVELHRRLNALSQVFPELATAERPQRHTIVLSCLTAEDLGLLRELLEVAQAGAGYNQARVDKDPPSLEDTLNAR